MAGLHNTTEAVPVAQAAAEAVKAAASPATGGEPKGATADGGAKDGGATSTAAAQKESGTPADEARKQAGEAKPEITPSVEKPARSEFGVLKAGNFEYTPELRKSYQESAEILAAQMNQFKRSGGKLSEAQQRFLELYNKNPETLLNTAEGWITTHLVLEHEMFIRSAIIEQDLRMFVKETGKQPTPGTETTVSVEEFRRGFLNKWGPPFLMFGLGAPITLPVIGVMKAYESAVTHDAREIKLQLGSQTIDTDSLSDTDKKYIDYLSTGTNKQQITDFLLQSGDSQQEFYKTLGIDLATLRESPTSWYRFGYSVTEVPATQRYEYNSATYRYDETEATPRADLLQPRAMTVEGAMQGLGTSWEQHRMQQVKEIVQQEFNGRFPEDPKDRAKLYSLAQQATIEHFANEALLGSIDSPDNQASIDSMRSRAGELRDPTEAKKLRTKKTAELSEANTRIEELDRRIKESQTAYDQKEEQVQIIDAQQQYIQDEVRTRVSQFTITEESIISLTQLRDQAATRYNETIAQYDETISQCDQSLNTSLSDDERKRIATQKASAQAQRVATEAKKNDHNIAYGQLIDKEKGRLNELRNEIESRRNELRRQAVLQVEMRRMHGQLEEYNRERTELETRRDALKDELENPPETDAQKTAAQLEMIISSLERYEDVIGEVFAADTVDITLLTDQSLADRLHTKFNGELERGKEVGYLATLDHLFQYSKAKDPIGDLRHAQKILPRTTLKILIEKHLGLTTPSEDLSGAFQEVQNRNLTPSQFTGLFIDIMDYVENSGLRKTVV